jgi:predicted Zn-dependent protease with MMP-like domain
VTTRRERLSSYREARHRFRPDRRQFEQLIAEALDSIPTEFRAHLVNVAILVQEQIAPRENTEEIVLGTYEGAGALASIVGDGIKIPDRITLYRQPILAGCTSRSEVIQEIRDTLIHEIGHHFDLDEHELP